MATGQEQDAAQLSGKPLTRGALPPLRRALFCAKRQFIGAKCIYGQLRFSVDCGIILIFPARGGTIFPYEAANVYVREKQTSYRAFPAGHQQSAKGPPELGILPGGAAVSRAAAPRLRQPERFLRPGACAGGAVRPGSWAVLEPADQLAAQPDAGHRGLHRRHRAVDGAGLRGVLLPQLFQVLLLPALYHRHDRPRGHRLRRHHHSGCGAAPAALYPAVHGAAGAVHPAAPADRHGVPHGQVVAAVPAGDGAAAGRHGQLSGPLGRVQGRLYLRLQRRHRRDTLRSERHRAAGDHLRHLRPAPPAAAGCAPGGERRHPGGHPGGLR